MADLPGLTWLMIGGATALCVLTALAVCAGRVRDQCTLHDLRVEAKRLRAEYERSVLAINQGERAPDPAAPVMTV